MSARRRHRPTQQAATQPAPRVEVAFTHLPPESRAELQQALLNWARWHAQRYLAGYVPPSVASGRLAVEPAQLLGGGTDGAGTGGWAMEDVPAAPAALPSNFNVAYEQEEDVPRYDRATLRPLRPVGGAAGQRRAALLEAAGEAAPGFLLPSARCYNCGSYGHAMGQCFRERDAEAEAASLKQREDRRAAQAGGRRYWTVLLGAGQEDGLQASPQDPSPAAVPPAPSGLADGLAGDYIPLDPDLEQQDEQGVTPRQAHAAQAQALQGSVPVPLPKLQPVTATALPPPVLTAEQAAGQLPWQQAEAQPSLQQEPLHWRQPLHGQQPGGFWSPAAPPAGPPPAPTYTPMPCPPPYSGGSPAYPWQPAAFYPHPTNLQTPAPTAGLPGSAHTCCPAPQQPWQPQQAEYFGPQYGPQHGLHQQQHMYWINGNDQQLAWQPQALQPGEPPPPPPPPPL